MGQISASRCRVCQGKGNFGLDTLPEVTLYEWMEGYLDEDTDDEWLVNQLGRLIEIRRKRRADIALGRDPDAEDEDGDSD